MNLNSIACALLFLLGSVLLNAQITYTVDDFTGIDEFYQVINTADAGGADFTETGADFTWNFSGMAQEEPETYGYENPNNSEYKTIWCLFHFYITNCDTKFNENFNLGLPLGDVLNFQDLPMEDIYQHVMKTHDALQLKMYGAQITLDGNTIPAVLEYDDPDDLFRFPVEYNDSYVDTNHIDMDFSALGVNVQIESDGERTNTVEGWGSLQIPNYQFSSTLKVKSVLNQTFNINNDGEEMSLPVDLISYFWFDKDYKIPVLMVQGTEIDGEYVPGLITYLHFEPDMAASDLNSEKVVIYPNPTTGNVNIKLPAGEYMEKIKVFDAHGRIVCNSTDLSSFPEGVYFLKIQTNRRTIQEKVIKE